MDPVSRAQSEENSSLAPSKRAHLAQFHWPKGTSGNPKGRPRKDQRITKMYDRIVRKVKNRKQIEAALMDTLTSKGMAKVLLLREISERLEGKVTQPMEVDVNISLSQRMEKAEERLGDSSND